MNEAYKRLNAIIQETIRKLDADEISSDDAMIIVKESRKELDQLESKESEVELLEIINTVIGQRITPGFSQ